MRIKLKKWYWVMVVLSIYSTTKSNAGSLSSVWEGTKKVGKKVTCAAASYFPYGGAIAKVFGLNESAEQTEVLKNIEKTNKDTLSEIKKYADTAMKTKAAIETANNRVHQAINLGKKLGDMSFKKMLLGHAEDVSGISLDPSRYIPNTKYTQKLKRNMKYSCVREKQTIGATNRFLKNTGKLVGLKAARGQYKDLGKLNKDLEKAIQYDHTVNEYANNKNLLLADILEKQADEVLFYEKNGLRISRNQEIQAMLDNEKSSLTPSERLHAQLALQANAIKAAELKDRAMQLRQEASKMTKAEKQAIAAQQDRLALRDMIKYELEERKRKRELRRSR